MLVSTVRDILSYMGLIAIKISKESILLSLMSLKLESNASLVFARLMSSQFVLSFVKIVFSSFTASSMENILFPAMTRDT